MLRDSCFLLRAAGALRDRGALPAGTALWATANPNAPGDAARLGAKADAGAEVVLTQPPLDWAAFQAWAPPAARAGPRLVVGLPVLTSSAGAAFWLSLCGAWGSAGARRVLADFKAAEAALAGAELEAWAAAWNEDLAARVAATPGVGGLHVMPLGARARGLVAASLASPSGALHAAAARGRRPLPPGR